VMELQDLVRFSSHSRPFHISECYCDNPECRCKSVLLTFTEVNQSGLPLEKPISFSVSVDVETWQERRPPQRAAEVAGWVQEFLEQCPKRRRAEFKSSFEQAKRDAARKATLTIDCHEVLAGTLVPYCDVQAENSALSSGGGRYTFEFDHQEREYLIEDQYCPNPSCDCQTVHLVFFEVVTQANAQPEIWQRFHGQVSFAGETTVEESFACDMAEADRVLAAWWKEHRSALKLFKARYKDIKVIGRRSLEAQTPSSRQVARRSIKLTSRKSLSAADRPTGINRVGRNEPCPCGSGKKYKKCCWSQAALTH
jgi:hypothetical protein